MRAATVKERRNEKMEQRHEDGKDLNSRFRGPGMMLLQEKRRRGAAGPAGGQYVLCPAGGPATCGRARRFPGPPPPT